MRAARANKEKYCDDAETARCGCWPIRVRSKIFPGDSDRKLSARDVPPRPSDGHAASFIRAAVSSRRILMYKVRCHLKLVSRYKSARLGGVARFLDSTAFFKEENEHHGSPGGERGKDGGTNQNAARCTMQVRGHTMRNDKGSNTLRSIDTLHASSV